jgi:peptidoglycan/LPS O-acetylase OafA/YrhL
MKAKRRSPHSPSAMSERPSETPSYRADIDGLRALAVLAVCLFHAEISVFPGGFVGVSVFFVISGNLMATVLSRGLERADFRVTDFYERRARRIFPALFVVLFFCAVVGVAVVPPHLFRELGVTLAGTVALASNVVLWWRSANYFDATSTWNPLLHTWSLAIELQFYVLFPLYLWLIRRVPWRTRFVLTALLTLVSFTLSVWATANAPTAALYLLPSRVWELLLGALVGLWTTRTSVESRCERALWPAVVGECLGLALVLGSLLRYDREMAFPGAAALAPTAGTALLIHFGGDSRSPVAQLLGLAPLAFIGRISYSLYLWHWPLLVFADRYRPFGPLGTMARLGVIALSGVVAYASWRWVEQPFRWRRPHASRAALYGAGASAAGLAAFGAFAQLSDGWPGRFPEMALVSLVPQLVTEQRAAGWQEFNGRRCFVERAWDWEKERCFLGKGAASNALLWGDSFANSYARGFFGNERSRFNVLEYTSPQCPPIVGYQAASRPQCGPFDADIAKIVERYDISTVIMAANWSTYFRRRKLGQDDIRNTETLLRSLGVRVVLVGQSPVFSFAYPDEYFFRSYGSSQTERDYSAPPDLDLGMNQSMAKLATGSTFFDPLAVFCHGSECTFKRGDQYLFVDYGHYTGYGSKLAVDALLDALNGATASAVKKQPTEGP